MHHGITVTTLGVSVIIITKVLIKTERLTSFSLEIKW